MIKSHHSQLILPKCHLQIISSEGYFQFVSSEDYSQITSSGCHPQFTSSRGYSHLTSSKSHSQVTSLKGHAQLISRNAIKSLPQARLQLSLRGLCGAHLSRPPEYPQSRHSRPPESTASWRLLPISRGPSLWQRRNLQPNSRAKLQWKAKTGPLP